MKKILIGFVLGIFIVFGSVPAMAVLIDFEPPTFGINGITGPEVTNQYPELTFSSTAPYTNYVSTQPGIGFGSNFLCSGAVGSINCVAETIATFTNPVNNLQFYGVGSNATGVVANIDVFTNGIFSATLNFIGTAQFFTPILADLSAYNNVTSIRIYNITDGGGLGWDNFSFTPVSAPIPEPGTMMLLGSGLVGLVGYGRRRFKK